MGEGLHVEEGAGNYLYLPQLELERAGWDEHLSRNSPLHQGRDPVVEEEAEGVEHGLETGGQLRDFGEVEALEVELEVGEEFQ